jgi:hypothetical protein
MTSTDLNHLPFLLTRAQVVQILGINDKVIDAIRVEVTREGQAVPWPKIGAIRGLGCSTRKGAGNYKYRREDVIRLAIDPHPQT